jgi:hypothetical protein
LLNKFDDLDRVSIVEYALNGCYPFWNDSPAAVALKKVYMDIHRCNLLPQKEMDKARDEKSIKDGYIKEQFEQLAKQPDLFAKMKINLEQM